MITADVDKDRPLLNVEEAGELLGLSRATMYRAIHKGELPFPLLRISGRWRIPRRALERLVDGEPLAPAVQPAGMSDAGLTPTDLGREDRVDLADGTAE